MQNIDLNPGIIKRFDGGPIKNEIIFNNNLHQYHEYVIILGDDNTITILRDILE